MGTCRYCGKSHALVSAALGACKDCIVARGPEEISSWSRELHARLRSSTDMGTSTSTNADAATSGNARASQQPGSRCVLCERSCNTGKDAAGYCGLHGGGAKHVATATRAFLHAYLDRNPTNCCMAWTCPAGSGLGFPGFKKSPGIELGTFNYAVFFKGCNFDCLFCQNPDHQFISTRDEILIGSFIKPVLDNEQISCICYFGGSPEPQIPFSINATKTLLEMVPRGRVLRACWEWNGAGNPAMVKACASLAYRTGGNLKFDLKAWTPSLNEALCDAGNARVLSNFELVGKAFHDKRPGLPVIGATTLLVPGYVDAIEVESIAKFIASINREMPYSLLVFHPDHHVRDLPITPRKHVLEAKHAAEKHLEHVNVGNLGLLRD
ncbi:MAG: radical SAM protein [Candidatus Sigynarchaeota archaeon]